MKLVKQGIKSLKEYYNGIKSTLITEKAFRIDIAFCLVLFVIALFLPISGSELAILISSLILFLIIKLANTIIRSVINMVYTEHHELSQKAKNIGNFIVLLAFFNILSVWGIILHQTYFMSFFAI